VFPGNAYESLCARGKRHREDIQKLSKLTGNNFDREYITHMVKDHEKDVSAFEKQSKKGDAPELRQFAAKTLPTLQEHLKVVRAMRDSTKN
jgi:putative membrane protein